MADAQSMQAPAKNRWFIVVGALLIQLCLGAIYSWSAFTACLQAGRVEVLLKHSPDLLGLKPGSEAEYAATRADVQKRQDALMAGVKAAMKSKDREAESRARKELGDFKRTRLTDAWLDENFDRTKFDRQAFGFTAKQAQLPYCVGLATFALVMILAGRWQDKAGPRVVAVTGGVILGLGYLFAGLFGQTFWPLLIGIGLIGGAGIGLGYVCPIAASVKWFPDMKGFITGLAVAGFGAGAFIFINLAGSWGNLIRDHGVNTTFLVLGAIFLVCVVLGALMLSNPPAGYRPAGWNPPQAASGSATSGLDLTQGQTVRTPQFWMAWLAFVFSGGCGLMVIGSIGNFGELEGGLKAGVAASLAGVLALFNGLGRIVWGTLAQKITPRRALMIMVFLQGAMMFALPALGGSLLTLGIGACWIGFNFGGNFAIFPLLTAEFFGTRNLGANYGAVFTAYGAGGILGPILAGSVWDEMGTYRWAFLVAGAACVASGLIALVLRSPRSSAEPASQASGGG